MTLREARAILEQRDYKREYRRYHGRPEQVARRSSRNKARRKMIRTGRIRKGDPRDIHHRDGNPKNNDGANLVARAVSVNRSRR